MSDVLGRMVQRSRGALSAIEPLIPPRYAASGRAADLVGGASAGRRAGPADPVPDPGQVRGPWPASVGQFGWPQPAREAPGTSAFADRIPAGTDRLVPFSIEPDLRRPRGQEEAAAGPARPGEPDGPARPASSGDPAGPGPELPARWVRPDEHPGPSRADQRSPSPLETADGGNEPAGLPAGPRRAQRAAAQLGRDHGARPYFYPGALTDVAGPASPMLTIAIGHIEVRAAPEGSSRPRQMRPEPPPRPPFRPQVTLAEFLGRAEPGQVQGRRR
jgi:hypothetical protein